MSANNMFMKHGYLSAPLANGIGRFVLQCQRITIKFCKSYGGSNGVRDFIEKDLVDFARKNPSVVVYLKPRRHRSPVLVAEYLNGGREWMSLQGMDGYEVAQWVEIFRASGGNGDLRLKCYQKTEIPSIQGPWNPFVHKDPQKNLMEFPNEALGSPSNITPTATEIILELYNKKVEEAKRAEKL